MSPRRLTRLVGSTSVLVAALTLGCRQGESVSARARRAVASVTSSGPESESELTRSIEWTRDQALLTNRHMAELDAESKLVEAKYPPGMSNKYSQDPEFLALVARQRAEMQQLMSRVPQGLTVTALGETLPGIVRTVAGTHGIGFVAARDEAVLAAARAKFGAEFVSWVLDHEQTIVTTLTSASAPPD